MGGVGVPPFSSPTIDRLPLLRSCALPRMVMHMLSELFVSKVKCTLAFNIRGIQQALSAVVCPGVCRAFMFGWQVLLPDGICTVTAPSDHSCVTHLYFDAVPCK